LRFFRSEEGGRTGPVASGYRADLTVDGLSNAAVLYVSDDEVRAGETREVELVLANPEYLQGGIRVGNRITLNEGRRAIAEGTIADVISARDPALHRTHAVVVLDERCPQCGDWTGVHYVQRLGDSGVRYSQSVRCAQCGCMMEADGGELPDVPRALFLSQYGHWELRVVEVGARRVDAVRALAAALDLPPAKALERLRPGARLFDGTRVEVEWLDRRLSLHGVILGVVEVSDDRS
jgi:hypothetical protein